MKGIWSNTEVKKLFSEVEDCKRLNKSLKKAFLTHAKNFNRKPNSVRNYYYTELARLNNDKKRAEEIGINLESHQKNKIKTFTEEEKNMIITKIKEKLSEGYSVRKACMLLSGGNVQEMLRLQNKYRADNKTKKNNVLEFKNKSAFNKITEADINSLFSGLVKLVKKNAIEEAKESISEYRLEKENLIRKLIIDLGEKERQLKFLKDDYMELKKENALLKKKLVISTCFKASQMNQKQSGA